MKPAHWMYYYCPKMTKVVVHLFNCCSFNLLIGRSSLKEHIKSVFMLLFQRLQNSKTTKFVKGKKYATNLLLKIV